MSPRPQHIMKKTGPGITRRHFLKTLTRASTGLLVVSTLPGSARSTAFPKAVSVERSFYTMGSIMTISAFGEERSHVNYALTNVYGEFQRLDRMMSLFRPDSELSAVNRSAGESAVTVSRELMEVVLQARYYHRLSDGDFDITIEPLMQLWGFRSDALAEIPTPTNHEIRRISDAVGFHHVELDERQGSIGLRNPDSRLDLGGIGVGYAIDRAVSILRREGIRSAFINHSGDAYALGAPPGESGWEVAIPDPGNPSAFLRELNISDRAISTSGSYEKNVIVGGRKCGHIMEPLRGTPADRLLSSTVLAPTALAADVLATSAFCLGTTATSQLLARQAETEFLLVEQAGNSVQEIHFKGARNERGY
ncbi:MAG: FAD:protein FMN transferase [Ignavibacteria bacterium]|nr:FAD:protein FMN transferase [Ignavibacteria bacterium]